MPQESIKCHVLPLRPVHASHLAFPERSNIPGLSNSVNKQGMNTRRIVPDNALFKVSVQGQEFIVGRFRSQISNIFCRFNKFSLF
jgi:hypothetical protein